MFMQRRWLFWSIRLGDLCAHQISNISTSHWRHSRCSEFAARFTVVGQVNVVCSCFGDRNYLLQNPCDYYKFCCLLLSLNQMHRAFISGENFDMLKRSTEASLFPAPSYVEMIQDEARDLSQFKIIMPSFLSIGQWIKTIYEKSDQDISYLTTYISLNDLCLSVHKHGCDSINENCSEPIVNCFDEMRPNTVRPSPIRSIFQEVLPSCFR